MDNEVKPTWKLAWGLWWRMFVISLGMGLGIAGIIYLILFAVGLETLTTWLSLLF